MKRNWLYLLLFLFIMGCYSSIPGEDGSNTGGSGNGNNGGSPGGGEGSEGENGNGGGEGENGGDPIESVLSWFTEAEYKKIAPITYPGGTAMNGQLGYSQCRGASNAPSDPSKPFYTYDAFVKALKNFPNMFMDTTNNRVATLDQQKRILAAFFGNSAQETNGSWEPNWDPHGVLCWVGESGYYDNNPPAGCGYDAAPNGYCYNGRGPLQLTWSYNYRDFSQAYFGDDRAFKDPRIVSSTGEIAFASAFWYFTNYVKDHNSWKNGPKGLAQYMVSPRKFKNKKRDFAYTAFLINGGLECGPAPVNNYGVKNRITAFKLFFQEITGKAFIDNDDKLECDDMQHLVDDDALASAPLWL